MNKVKLGDLVEFQRGYDLPKNKIQSGKYPVITSNGILGYHNEYKSGPSVVIGRSGTIGNPQLINEKFWAHNTTLFIKDFKGNDIKYIYYLLLNTDINKMKSGSNIPTLNRNHLHPISVNATTDKILQRKIANTLSNIDNKIELNNKINDELESMAKTIYDYWFLQFEFPNEEGKPYKSSGGKMVWNEELKREIPEGWEVKHIIDILDNVPNSTKINTKEYLNRGKYPIIDQSSKYICGYTNDDNAVLSLKDAIIFGDHTKCIKYINFEFARGADGTQVILSKERNLSNLLLYYQIKDMHLVNQGYSRYFKFLKEQKIIIPDKYTKELFDNIEVLYKKIRKNLFENQELISLRDFLLPLLMNGQVGFKEDKA